MLKLLNSGQSETIDHYIIFRGRNSLIILNLPLDTIPLNLGSSRYHKIQNPALHPFGVAGFWVTIDHFKSSFLIGLKEETWFQNITECCLYLTPQKVNGNWGLDSGYSILDPGYWMLVTGYHSTRVWQIRPSHFGFWVADCGLVRRECGGFHVFGAIITEGFDIYGHNWITFLKILHIFRLNPDWLSLYGYDERLAGVVVRWAKLCVPQKYHLDISNIQQYRKVAISAMLSSAFSSQ